MWGGFRGDRLLSILLLALCAAAWLAPRAANATEALPTELTLTGTIRDFLYCQAPGVPAGCSPDFEPATSGPDPGIVEPFLGPDGKPVWNGAAPHPTVSSKESFDAWFRDLPGVNRATELPVTLLQDPTTGTYTFASYRFYPIDSRLLGNQGLAHNFHFTYELRTRFTYNGGELFTYRSNGDLWIFMNGQLVVDLGGVHSTLDATLNMDELAARLELVPGQSYDLDLFFAQRRAPASVLMFQTSLYMAPQPEVAATGGTFPEGSPARMTVAVGNDGGAPHTAAVDWGDAETTPPAPVGDVFDFYHTYVDNGGYVALVSLDYGGAEPVVGVAEFLIRNVAPQVTATARPGGRPGSILLQPAFTDPGLRDSPWRFWVDWGDGTYMNSWAADPSLMPQSIYHIYEAPGTYSVGVRVMDKDGDVGVTSLSWLADMTPPRIAHSVTPEPGASGWHRTAATVAFACADDGSGLLTCPQAQVVTTEGADVPVTGTAVDRAGNRTTDTARVSIDLTPPVLTAAYGGSAWFTGDVTIDWIATDALSGIDPATLPPPAVVTGEGIGLGAIATVMDRAGNLARRQVDTIRIDRTPPVTTARAPVGWSRTDVAVALSASDNLSGVRSTSWRLDGGPWQQGSLLSVGEGVHTVEYFSEDLAGNREAVRISSVSVDRTAPMVTAEAPTGWQRSDVTVRFTCTDALSGVATCTEPVTVTAQGRDQLFSGEAADLAGNRAAVTARVSIDKTAPVITFAGNTGLYEVDATIAISCTASDGLSGLAASACPGFSGPAWAYTPGEITLAAQATDLAGNTGQGTATFTIMVTFDGLCRLTEQFSDSAGVSGALCSKLRTAKEAALSGDYTSQNAALDRYMRDVQVHSGKNLTVDEEETLVRLAANLRR